MLIMRTSLLHKPSVHVCFCSCMAAFIFTAEKCISWKASVGISECLSVLSAQASGRVMQWWASVSKAPLLLLGVLVDSATRLTESLSISEWLFSNSWRERSLHRSVFFFSVHWRSHLLPMNGCVARRRSPPPPPLLLHRSFTGRARAHDAVFKLSFHVCCSRRLSQSSRSKDTSLRVLLFVCGQMFCKDSFWYMLLSNVPSWYGILDM